jgi:hypothetical protein
MTEWATFTYCTKEVRQITKPLKNTRMKVAFHTQNTIKTLKHHTQTDKYNNSGIYQMKCLDCPLKYTGQTGRTFSIRYKEHNHAIKNNHSNSGYSNHIQNTGYTYGTITDTRDVTRTGREDRHLNTLEKYHIYKISRSNLHMNDTCNPIFQILHELYDSSTHTSRKDNKVQEQQKRIPKVSYRALKARGKKIYARHLLLYKQNAELYFLKGKEVNVKVIIVYS